MVFSSIAFLYYFLPVTLLLYIGVPKALRNLVLLLASLIFYFYGEPIYTLLLTFSSFSDYIHSLYIEKNRGTSRAKWALISSVTVNLGMLFFFKYADFLILNVNEMLGFQIPTLNLTLPIGISFFTFQTMSYTIDVYRGDVSAERNPIALAAYVSLFPQLVAGPIVRYKTIADALKERTLDIFEVSKGMGRFLIGLGKKVLIANQLGELTAAFAQSKDLSVHYYWLYAMAFSLQIYFDFSGYSDMAIGLGRIFGFTFLENFNYPFVSKSITEFWRRWHISLGSWFRDYVYIPLGGNRGGQIKWIRNIAIVWLLTGLWHGAAWNFVLWGGLFGGLLIFEKILGLKLLERLPIWMRHGYVIFTVLVSFVIFNANGFTGAMIDVASLFGYGNLPLTSSESIYQMRSYAGLLLVAVISATPLPKALYNQLDSRAFGASILTVIEPVALGTLLILVTAFLVDGSFNPFLYFRF